MVFTALVEGSVLSCCAVDAGGLTSGDTGGGFFRCCSWKKAAMDSWLDETCCFLRFEAGSEVGVIFVALRLPRAFGAGVGFGTVGFSFDTDGRSPSLAGSPWSSSAIVCSHVVSVGMLTL